MPDGPAVLIAAVSGRALAASARRAGFVALVADCFGDDDTLALARAHARIRLDDARGIEPETLLRALERLAAAHPPIGIVCGTGFEDRPALLDRVGRRWRLLGNAPGTVARLKDPDAFAALCRDCGVAHPATSLDAPRDSTGWIAKRAGGAGGAHVRGAQDPGEIRGTTYYQRRVPGMAVSALVLGDGRTAMVLGWSTQWTAPTQDRPFRYGGAVRPARLSSETSAALRDAVERVCRAMPLVGLNSFDFLVDRGTFRLLEINPRPGATLDIFEPNQGSLFGLHVAACDGALPAEPPKFPDAAASCIVYADRVIRSVPAIDWPAWAADRQRAATSLRTGDPFCTVLARAATADEAREIVTRRAQAILANLDARVHEHLPAH